MNVSEWGAWGTACVCIRDYTIVNLTSGKVFSEVVVVVVVVVGSVVLVLLCINKNTQQR